jgi:hypothetical protein
VTEIRDVYSRITGKIIADLEQSIRLAQAVERRPCRRQDHPPVAA